MNLFIIPYNIYFIISLFTLKHINPLKLIFFAGHLSFVAFGIGVFLCIYLYIHPENNVPKEVQFLYTIKNNNYIYSEEYNNNDNDLIKPKKHIYSGEDDMLKNLKQRTHIYIEDDE